MHGMNGRILFFSSSMQSFFAPTKRAWSLMVVLYLPIIRGVWISGGVGKLWGIIIKIKVSFGINMVGLYDLSYYQFLVIGAVCRM